MIEELVTPIKDRYVEIDTVYTVKTEVAIEIKTNPIETETCRDSLDIEIER